ncbi:MAG TPA: hypothetical protein VFZ58_04920 [Candidatus Saccharimonadales bacterium]
MNMEVPHPQPEATPNKAEQLLGPEAQKVVELYSSARNELDPDRQLQLLRQIEASLHKLLEPEVTTPFQLSDQALRDVMLRGSDYFLLGGGSQGQRLVFESERFEPGQESADGKPKWLRYPPADTVGREMRERFIQAFRSDCVDIAPGVEAVDTGF